MTMLARIGITAPLLLISFLPFSATSREKIPAPEIDKRASCNDTLRILLSNDDGFDQPGITALQQALNQAEHQVVVAAPAKNASGSSASITFAPVAVAHVETNTYAVRGSRDQRFLPCPQPA